MKLNFILTTIALCTSALIAYGFYSFGNSDTKLLLSFGSFVTLAFTLVFTIGVNFPLPRTSINLKTISVIFFVFSFVSNLIFAFFSFSTPIYVTINGMLLMIYCLILYSINSVKQ